MTQSEMAKMLDMSERNLREVLKKLGFPARGFDSDAVRIAYIRSLRATASRSSPGGGSVSVAEERAKLLSIQRQKAEIELRNLKGELVPVDEVKNFLYASARQARDRLQMIPPKMCHALVGEDDYKTIESLLNNEINTALEDLSKWNP